MIIRLSNHGWCVLIITFIVIILYYFSSHHSIGRLKGEVISIKQLLSQCIYLAEEAGDKIKVVHASNKLNARTKLNSNEYKMEPLTNADLQSHQTVLSGINALFPTLKVRSEERLVKPIDDLNSLVHGIFHSNFESYLPNNDLFVPQSDLLIWLDPLDATQEFTEGLLEYVTVMVCIVLHGRPIAGVIHQPFMNKTYWAWTGHAISSDLQTLIKNQSKFKNDENCPLNVTYSRSHLNDSVIKSLVKSLNLQKTRFFPAGGSGFKVLSLINGTADLYVHPSATRRWDVCAAQAVLEAAGGKLTGFDGTILEYGKEEQDRISSQTGLFAAFTKEVHERWIKKFREAIANHYV